MTTTTKTTIALLCLVPLAASAQTAKVIEQPTVTTASPRPEVLKLINQCLVIDAKTTLNVEIGKQSSAESNGGKYAERKKCPRFLVDVVFPNNGGYMAGLGGEYAGTELTKTTCAKYHDEIYIWQKQDNGTLQLVGGGKRTGKWYTGDEEGFPGHAKGCEPVEGDGFKSFSYFAMGKTYRIAFAARVGTQWRKVKVTAGTLGIPK